jgi:hypothetical protein
VDDADLVGSVAAEVRAFAQRLQTMAGHQQGAAAATSAAAGHMACLGLVETAGGVASPAPSGRLMVRERFQIENSFNLTMLPVTLVRDEGSASLLLPNCSDTLV